MNEFEQYWGHINHRDRDYLIGRFVHQLKDVHRGVMQHWHNPAQSGYHAHPHWWPMTFKPGLDYEEFVFASGKHKNKAENRWEYQWSPVPFYSTVPDDDFKTMGVMNQWPLKLQELAGEYLTDTWRTRGQVPILHYLCGDYSMAAIYALLILTAECDITKLATMHVDDLPGWALSKSRE